MERGSSDPNMHMGLAKSSPLDLVLVWLLRWDLASFWELSSCSSSDGGASCPIYCRRIRRVFYIIITNIGSTEKLYSLSPKVRRSVSREMTPRVGS
jgi:hypothetical protein